MTTNPLATSTAIHIEVPMLPPSVNRYVRHVARKGKVIHYKSDEANTFKTLLTIAAKGKSIRAKSYAVLIEFELGNGSKSDLDNLAKCVLDGLQSSGVIDTDSKVVDLRMSKHRGKEDHTMIIVQESFLDVK